MSSRTKLILPSHTKDQVRAFLYKHTDAFIQSEQQVPDIEQAGQLTQFVYNHDQQRIAHFQRWHERRGFPSRLMVLKARQRGVSTQQARRNLIKAMMRDQQIFVTIAQLEGTASSLLDKMRSARQQLPEWLQFKLSHDSDYEIAFAEICSSIWIVSMANLQAIKILRGQTAQGVHATEYPLWADFLLKLSEIMSICHAKGATCALLEGTGKGRDGGAHKFWKASKKDETGFTPMFLDWQSDPTTDLDRGKWSEKERHEKMAEVAEYEPELIRRGIKYKLTVGQVWQTYLWLKYVKFGIWQKFLEDYPLDDDEAWQAIGSLYYDDNQRLALIDRAKSIAFVGYQLSINELELGFTSFKELSINPAIDCDSEEPYIIIWTPPEPTASYVISGYSTAGNTEMPSSTYVVNINTGEQCAEFHGNVKPHQHARIMYSLGVLYNFAVAAPEVKTAAGLACLAELTRIRYPRMYYWRHIDDANQQLTNKLGWYSGIRHIELTLTLLARVLEQAADGKMGIHRNLIKCRGLLGEMGTFVTNPDTSSPEPQADCSATRIAALAIAWYVGQMETQGREDSILEALRPSQILTDGHKLGKEPTVDEQLAKIRKLLRMDEYSHGEEKRQWWD